MIELPFHSSLTMSVVQRRRGNLQKSIYAARSEFCFAYLAPIHTYPDIFKSATFFPDLAFVHTYPVNLANESETFLNTL